MDVFPHQQGKRSRSQGSGARAKHSRGRTGCLSCRRRRKKCDEQRPECSRCERLGEQCRWQPDFTFRSWTASTNGQDIQSLQQPATDVLDDGGHRDAATSSVVESPIDRLTDSIEAPIAGYESESLIAQGAHSRSFVAGYPLDGPVGGHAQQTFEGAAQEVALSGITTARNGQPMSVANTGRAVDSNASENAGTHIIDYSDHNVNRDWPSRVMANESTSTSSIFASVSTGSPDALMAYYPNAQYKELHATFYHRMVDTAKGTGLTRYATSEPLDASSANVPHTFSEKKDTGDSSVVEHPLPSQISKTREYQLWTNYLDELCSWLDMFDNNRHFRVVIPLLAQKSQHLRFSCLALSSRQLERKDNNKPYIESLSLYQEAIHLVSKDLHLIDTTVIASCVLLCVLEMMSSSPRDWARHLDGCGLLIKAAGIDGAAGGTNQAIFWCFARMDMWACFVTESELKIPISLWFFHTESFGETMERLRLAVGTPHQYANVAVFLCARTFSVLAEGKISIDDSQWQTVFDLLEAWYEQRPPEMKPILTDVDTSSGGNFPILVFTNTPAISGNQLYHAAKLLLLQFKPRQMKVRRHKSIFWHARQVVGITASNSDHGAYTNAPHALWIAGRVLSHRDEHGVVLRLLNHIEEETGFAAAWRVDELKSHWGENDELYM